MFGDKTDKTSNHKKNYTEQTQRKKLMPKQIKYI